MRSPSRIEAFIDDKPEWISDKFFTQQRLAGTNPLSIKRVTIQGEGRNFTTVLPIVALLYTVPILSVKNKPKYSYIDGRQVEDNTKQMGSHP